MYETVGQTTLAVWPKAPSSALASAMVSLRKSNDIDRDSSALIDPFRRAITYLRISVTDRCDFRCAYCMAEDVQFLPKRDLLTLDKLGRLCDAFVAHGVRKLRITGGEPLVRRYIKQLFRRRSRHLGSWGRSTS